MSMCKFMKKQFAYSANYAIFVTMMGVLSGAPFLFLITCNGAGLKLK